MFINTEPEEIDETYEKNHMTGLALSALILGMIGFLLSAITPWVMDIFAPEATIIATEAENISTLTFWQWMVGPGFAPNPGTGTPLHSVWTLFVMLGSFGALGLGVIAFVRREDTRICALAMAFGFLGIFMQYMMVFAGVLLLLIMLYLVLASFGVS